MSSATSKSARPQVSLQAIDQELREALDARVMSGLDALRALAISLVLIDHFLLTDYFLGFHPQIGPVGVTIFFVLSGFLITAMLLKEYRRTNDISLVSFYRRRAYRIFPTFYCCWILTTIVDLVAHQIQWKWAAISFFYLMDYGLAFGPANTGLWLHMGISWSLAIEEKFYLLWPLLLLFLLKRPTPIRTLVSIIAGLWIYRAILSLMFHVNPRYFYFAFDMRAADLLVGCLVALLVQHKRTRLYCCAVLRRQWLSFFPPLALALMMVAPYGSRVLSLSLNSMQPLIIAVMLLQAVYWGAKSWTVCSSAVVRVTARLSYALYLYHPMAGKIVYLLHMRHLGYYAAILTVVLAAGSYYLVERPFMRMRDRRQPPVGATLFVASAK